MYTTETLDKSYLEYSNITKAKTAKEIKLENENKDIILDIARKKLLLKTCYQIIFNDGCMFPEFKDILKRSIK